MNSMRSINQKTALVAIAAIAIVFAVSAIAIGNVHNALADKTVNIHVTNTGINVPSDTDQRQDCQTAGGISGISDSSHATSIDWINQTGGQLTT